MPVPTNANPLVSVLITTFNRGDLLKRAVSRVLMQDFEDFELVILDDCSSDHTPEFVASFNDERIRYIRNEENFGFKHGDRAHVRRFVYELMRGKYFVYVCDDDYWLPSNLLSRQVDALRKYDDVAMVIAGQLSHFITTPESLLGWPADEPIHFTLENLRRHFDFEKMTPTTPHLYFHTGLYSREFLTSEEFLTEFAADPPSKNIIVGATLYSKEHFVRSGAMSAEKGSSWQAGYEFLMGPACSGNVTYIDEPAILTEIRAENASFQRTQVDHYLDAITSVETAFHVPLTSSAFAHKKRFFKQIKKDTIRNLSRSFLDNTVRLKRQGHLGMCSEQNIGCPVTFRNTIPVFVRNGVIPKRGDIEFLLDASLPVAAVDYFKIVPERSWLCSRTGFIASRVYQQLIPRFTATGLGRRIKQVLGGGRAHALRKRVERWLLR